MIPEYAAVMPRKKFNETQAQFRRRRWRLILQQELAKPPEAPEPTGFPCPDCDKVYDKANGLRMHQNRWCKGKA